MESIKCILYIFYTDREYLLLIHHNQRLVCDICVYEQITCESTPWSLRGANNMNRKYTLTKMYQPYVINTQHLSLTFIW